MERYYQPEIECASREQIERWQSQRLIAQVRRIWENVPYYRKKMEEKGVTPEDIQGVRDLPKLPFLSKTDLRDAYPYGLMGKPLKDCVRIHSTSGTTGKRVVAFTWSRCPTATASLPAGRVWTAGATRWAVSRCPCPPATRIGRSCSSGT